MSYEDDLFTLTPSEDQDIDREGLDYWHVKRAMRHFMRRYNRQDAFDYALARVRNAEEQASRRCAHLTGCER
jgi:hypothetical protein